jgi:hypothetical protein
MDEESMTARRASRAREELEVLTRRNGDGEHSPSLSVPERHGQTAARLANASLMIR